MKQAVDAGELKFGRDSIIVLNSVRPGSIYFNATHVHGFYLSESEQRSLEELEGRWQLESVSEFMINYVPGFEKAWVNDTSNEVGSRESCHIVGLYTLTGEDVAEDRKFDDVVSRGYFPIDDIHNPNGAEGYRQDGQGGHWIDLKDTYDIPLCCMVPAHIDGIVLRGRCISGTSQAHGSYRTQGGIMGIGQASGVVAELCAIQGVQPREIDVKAVQLLAFGASLWRDKEKSTREQAHATACVKAYIKGRDKFITRADVLKKFHE